MAEDAPALSLIALEGTLPERWRAFTPNPYRDHEEVVQRQLAAFIHIHPRAFEGFRSVPRHFHPRADPESLVLSLELICWYFAFDDPFDNDEVEGRSRRLVERMVGVLETGSLPPDPSGTEQLAARFRARACATDPSGQVWPRFIRGCIQWVGSIEPILRSPSKGVPTVAEYLELRLLNVGILPEFTLNELMLSLELEPSFLGSAEVHRFGDLSALVIALFNDVYSYERERRIQTQWNSLELRVLAGASLQDAYAAQVADVQRMIAEMEAIEADLCARGEIGGPWFVGQPGGKRRRAQSAYIRGMLDIVVGHRIWSHDGGRYVSPSSPFLELRTRTRPG